MARKSMIEKWKREPKFSSRTYTRCRICGRPHAVVKKFVLFVLSVEFHTFLLKSAHPNLKMHTPYFKIRRGVHLFH